MDAFQERFAPPALTGDDLAAEEIKAVIDANAKSIDEANIKLASEIWSTSEEASFIPPRGHERGWEQVKNFYQGTMGALFSERKLKVHNAVIRMYWNRKPESGDHSPVARWPSRTRTASAPRAPAGDSRSVLSAAPNIAKPTPTRRATRVPPAG
jgi:hypothetical protein